MLQPPKTSNVELKQIKEGKPDDMCKCPIALAIKDSYHKLGWERTYVETSTDRSVIGQRDKISPEYLSGGLIYNHSSGLTQWIIEYDQYMPRHEGEEVVIYDNEQLENVPGPVTLIFDHENHKIGTNWETEW